jgi:hypothetical protein
MAGQGSGCLNGSCRTLRVADVLQGRAQSSMNCAWHDKAVQCKCCMRPSACSHLLWSVVLNCCVGFADSGGAGAGAGKPGARPARRCAEGRRRLHLVAVGGTYPAAWFYAGVCSPEAADTWTCASCVSAAPCARGYPDRVSQRWPLYAIQSLTTATAARGSLSGLHCCLCCCQCDCRCIAAAAFLTTSPHCCCCRCRATLVVCAVSLVGQWVAEAQQKLGGSLRVYQYHGQGRIRDPAK